MILITGENDDEKALLGYGLGVSDLVHKPFNPDIICRRVNNVVDLYSYKNYLEQKLDEQKKDNSNNQPKPGDRAADSVSDRRATGNEKMIVHGDASLELERSRRKR